MSVTLQDIADQLDLSAATVSRSLRQDRLIAPATRARVNETARRLGYRSRERRSPREVERKAKTHALGLLLRSSGRGLAQNDTNLMKMMAGVMAVTDANRVLLHIHTLHQEEERHMAEDPTVMPPMIQDGVCQAIIAHGDQNEHDMAFLSNRVPVISMGRLYRSMPMDAAVADNVEGVHTVIKHLVELGHRRLAWVGAYYSATFLEARQAGFIQGCLHHGLEINQQHFFGREIFEGQDICDKQALLSAVQAGVTGFVCGNDYLAEKVIEVLEAAGHCVPDDISVTGFDAWQGPRRLTSVDPHFYEIGEAAAHLALQRIAKSASQPCIISVRCNLVHGDTTAPARQ
jgi:LacI family transcriptional regulator